MGENKTKTKAAMLTELESIKGLLLEADDIPILQEIIEPQVFATKTISDSNNKIFPQEQTPAKSKTETKDIFDEQQDFFSSELSFDGDDSDDFEQQIKTDIELLETLDEFDKDTPAVVTAKTSDDSYKTTFARPNLAKASGENPFLPEHIRARLHGNNPPPLFASEAARKIAKTSSPSRQLGNTYLGNYASSGNFSAKVSNTREEIIDSIIEKMMPDIEMELRQRLESLTKTMLDELNQ